MNTQTAIKNLQIITALDSLTYGLIYGFINTYILSLGGSHVHAGILTVGSLLGDLLSPDVVKVFTHVHGKRYALFFILNTAVVTHLMMVLSCTYWFTILVRILFSITNQSQYLCHELLLSKAQNKESKTRLQRNYSILSGSGYILGPIMSGYIFDSGFGYIATLSAFLTLVNICLLMKVTKDAEDADPEHAEKSVLEKACDNVNENLKEFKKCNPTNWDLLLMKYFFAGSVLIFFSKFTLILKNNYHSSSVVVGYTAAYINTVVFAATYYSTVIKSKVQKYPLIFTSEVSFLLLAVLMLLACYAPYYEIYMLLIALVIILRTLMLTIWQDLFSERNNESLMKLNNAASVSAGLTIPLLFGLLCNQIAHNAVILFSCIPMFLNWVITRLYSRYLKNDESNDISNTQEKKDS